MGENEFELDPQIRINIGFRYLFRDFSQISDYDYTVNSICDSSLSRAGKIGGPLKSLLKEN